MPQYSGVWNLAQQAQALTTQQWVTDPLFDYTTLLLQGDNTTGSAQNNLFLDSSPNQFAITRNGNTTQGTFSPFAQAPGWWSNYFDGSSNITLSSAAVQTNGAFTVECWLYITNNTGTGSQGFYTQYAAADGARMQMLFDDSDKKFKLTIGNSSYPSTQAYPGVYNTWTHVVFTRDGSNNFSFYINGLRDSVTTVTAGITSVNPMIGNRNGGGIPFYGYISNLRITTTAVYSGASFVVPNTPLQTVTGTTLLTCQSNRFVDNNTALTAKTLTPAGSPSVQAFSPLAPQYQYTPTVTGGSGYFDGTGDYLMLGTNVMPDISGAFTYECWFYPTATYAAGRQIFGTWNNNTLGWGLFLAKSSTFNGMYVYWYYGTYGANEAARGITADAIQLNAWNHILVTRNSSNVWSFYVNGTSYASTTFASSGFSWSDSFNFTDTSNPIGLGTSGYLPPSSYISGARLLIGTSSTPSGVPTVPPTAVTNTQLLCNFTNAGIYDGTLKNNLETVGNAQVSTSVVKYGSGSMYFDGTGDYLRLPPTDLLTTWFNSDYTIEYWVYPNAFASGGNGGSNVLSQSNPGSTSEYWSFGPRASGVVVWYYYNGAAQVVTSGTITTGVWTHLAFTYHKASNTMRIFINGVLNTTASVSGTPSISTTADPVLVGQGTTVGFNGYIDDLRITKGIARYTRNFTPPTVALPRQ